MAEQKTEHQPKKNPHLEDKNEEMLIRIFDQDIPGSKSVFVGLTKIKGISWALANAICLHLKLDKRMKVGDLGKEKIAVIEKELSTLEGIPRFLKNRRSDLETGTDKHLLTTDLDIAKEFDIKRLKKIKSYRGVRHTYGLPTRGQRTRSHFRKKKGSTGIRKKKVAA